MFDDDEIERHAWNAAFYDLGLRWHWDAETWRALQRSASTAPERLAGYVHAQHPHLLRAYDPQFLAQALEARVAVHRRACAHPCDWARLAACESST